MTKLYTKDFIIICIANLLLTIAFYALLPTIPFYLIDILKGNNSNVGWVLSIYTVSALAIRPFVGYFLDSYGRKLIFIISFLLFSLFSGSYLIANSIFIVFLLRFLHGGTWGTVSSAGQTIVVDLIPQKRRGEGISMYGMATTISMALGPFLGLTILKLTNFTYLFATSLIVSLLGFIIILFIDYPKYTGQKLEIKLKNFLEKKAIPIGIVTMIFTLSYGGIVGFIALFIRNTSNMLDSRIFFLAFAFGIALLRIFAGKIVDKSGPKKIVIIGFLLLTIGFMLLSIVTNPIVFYINAIVLGIGCGILMPSLQTIVNNMIGPERRGVANTTFFSFFDLGIGIGSIVTGIVSELFSSLAMAYLVYSITNIIGLVFFLSYAYKHYEKNMISQ